MTKSLQSIAEEMCYDALFELEDELGLEANFLPEVYFNHGRFNFNKIGLGEKLISRDSSFYSQLKKIIVLVNLNLGDVGEEVGHFLHDNLLGYDYKKNVFDNYSMRVLEEMIGYFCSKLIYPKRKSEFTKSKDFLFGCKNIEDVLQKIISEINYAKTEDEFDFLIYSQAYTLGEKLYQYYISNLFSKRKIRNLMKNRFEKEYSAFNKFIDLKYKILK